MFKSRVKSSSEETPDNNNARNPPKVRSPCRCFQINKIVFTSKVFLYYGWSSYEENAWSEKTKAFPKRFENLNFPSRPHSYCVRRGILARSICPRLIFGLCRALCISRKRSALPTFSITTFYSFHNVMFRC